MQPTSIDAQYMIDETRAPLADYLRAQSRESRLVSIVTLGLYGGERRKAYKACVKAAHTIAVAMTHTMYAGGSTVEARQATNSVFYNAAMAQMGINPMRSTSDAKRALKALGTTDYAPQP